MCDVVAVTSSCVTAVAFIAIYADKLHQMRMYWRPSRVEVLSVYMNLKTFVPSDERNVTNGPVPNAQSHSGSGEQWLIWRTQQHRLSLHFDNNGMCCVISCTFPASCCPRTTATSTASVRLTCFFPGDPTSDLPLSFFFLLTLQMESLNKSVYLFFPFLLIYPSYSVTIKCILHAEKGWWSWLN